MGGEDHCLIFISSDVSNFGVTLTNASLDPIKGGVRLAPYLTFNCLYEGDDKTVLTGDYLREFWTCPVCQVKLPMTMSERLRHQAACNSAEKVN